MKIEELLGKKPEEIPFCGDSNKMIDYIDALVVVLHREHARVLCERMKEHYRLLAQIDGLRDVFKKWQIILQSREKNIKKD